MATTEGTSSVDEEAASIDLDVLEEDAAMSAGEKDNKIRILTEELEQELTLTSSLTHIVAEKTSEVEYLQNKLVEQESKIHNLEDQIDEWTAQSETCDKVLEQKDCEIDMLKKALSIEKQQRRDLEEMMMEVGKENIQEREALERKVESLQKEIDKMIDERRKERMEREKPDGNFKAQELEMVTSEKATQESKAVGKIEGSHKEGDGKCSHTSDSAMCPKNCVLFVWLLWRSCSVTCLSFHVFA